MDPRTLLPHRYPFLLVDTIDEVEAGKSARGTKLVTGSEWLVIGSIGAHAQGAHVQGAHVQGAHVRLAMPHTLIVESLAQLSAAVMQGLMDSHEGAIGYFMGMNNARFRGEAVPGDLLSLHVVLRQFRRGICKTYGEATVDGRRIVRVDMTSIIRPAASGA